MEEIVHKARKESEKRMLAQVIAPIALFISEIMLKAYEKNLEYVLRRHVSFICIYTEQE